MASEPVQPSTFLPLGFDATPQDIAEVKARISALEEASQRRDEELAATKQDALQLKAEIATSEARLVESQELLEATRAIVLENEKHLNIAQQLAVLSPASIAPRPILFGDKKSDFIDWFIKIHPVLQMLADFSVQEQLDYINVCIDNDIRSKIHNACPEIGRSFFGDWKSTERYIKHIGQKYYRISMPGL